jgi:4-amino-4-deoxy-L-arabinose transferase-like glycosyltransferase
MTRGATAVKSIGTRFVLAWAALLVAKAVFASVLPLFGDEAFYWQEGRHLAWAYSDLPGFTAWLARVGVAVGGDTLLGLRWPFLLLGAAVPWLAVRIARREWGDAAGWQAGWLAMLVPLSGWLGTLALPDVPLVLACLLALDAVASLLRRVSAGALLELTLALSIGALTHYRFAPAIVAGLVGLLLLPRGRVLLAQPPVWGALAIGVLAWLPVLLWNRDHGGSGLEFQLLERHPWRLHAGGVLWPFVQALAVATPGLFVLALATARALALRWRAQRDDAAGLFLGIGAVSVGGYFLLSFFTDTERVSFHWPLAGWLALLCAAPPVFARWRPWMRNATMSLALAGHAALLVALIAYATPSLRASLAETRGYPDNFAGWTEIAAVVHQAQRVLPKDTRVVADNFMLGAQLGFATGNPDLPVLDHPLNHKHGRAAQLREWGLERQGAKDLGPMPWLLVVEDSARPLKERLAGYHDLCRRLGSLPKPRVLNVDHGRKRFLLFPVLEKPAPGPCALPALSWIDVPAAGAQVAGRARVEGWAFKDGVGLSKVEVLLDDQVVANAEYGIWNTGVAAYWKISTDPNHPKVAFAATIPLDGVAPGTHWLGLRLHGTDGSVEDGPQQRLEVVRN